MLDRLLLSILNIKGFGPKFLFRYKDYLIEAENSCETVLEAISFVFEKTNRIQKVALEEINEGINVANKILEDCLSYNIKVLNFLSQDYPQQVAEVTELWPLLYTVGNHKLLNRYSVGIIGTRTPDQVGMKISNRIGEYCTEEEVNLILNQQKGVTIEVLKEFDGTFVGVAASSLDQLYTPDHDIHSATMKCVVSPFSPTVAYDEYRYIEACKVVASLSNRLVLVQDAPNDDTRFVLSYFSRMERILGVILPVNNTLNHPKNAGNRLLIEKGKDGMISYCKAKDVNNKTFKCTIKVLENKNDFPQFFLEEELPF
ncbi:DNA-processing protein DprA [Flammeovirga sp. SubArs3]|uniref:DNA-processing protein DprA n=1 Tax=Flammeovirga sp. SubArs3 TaxID=2995316 RepID=UPI00248C02F4|nr:DNA-processing protein DprA [Flammeovirga sp. SubArs3]